MYFLFTIYCMLPINNNNNNNNKEKKKKVHLYNSFHTSICLKIKNN